MSSIFLDPKFQDAVSRGDYDTLEKHWDDLDEPEQQLAQQVYDSAAHPHESLKKNPLATLGADAPKAINDVLGLNAPQANPIMEGARRVNQGLVNVGVGMPAAMLGAATNAPQEIAEGMQHPMDYLKSSAKGAWDIMSAPYRPSNYNWGEHPVESAANLAQAALPFLAAPDMIAGLKGAPEVQWPEKPMDVPEEFKTSGIGAEGDQLAHPMQQAEGATLPDEVPFNKRPPVPLSQDLPTTEGFGGQKIVTSEPGQMVGDRAYVSPMDEASQEDIEEHYGAGGPLGDRGLGDTILRRPNQLKQTTQVDDFSLVPSMTEERRAITPGRYGRETDYLQSGKYSQPSDLIPGLAEDRPTDIPLPEPGKLQADALMRSIQDQAETPRLLARNPVHEEAAPMEPPVSGENPYDQRAEELPDNERSIDDHINSMMKEIHSNGSDWRKNFNMPIGKYENAPEEVKDFVTNNFEKKDEWNPGSSTMDQHNKLPKELGPMGAELQKHYYNGQATYSNIQKNTRPMLNLIESTLDEIPAAQREASAKRVVDVLDGKAGHETLATPEERDIFNAADSHRNYFKGLMEAKDLKVLDKDYFPHMQEHNANPGQYLTDRGFKNIPKDVTSGHIIERTDNSGNYSKDLVNTLKRYTSSMGRYLSYDDMIKFYNDDFLPKSNGLVKGDPRAGWKLNMAKNYVGRAFTPDIPSGKFDRFIDWGLGNFYDKTFNYNVPLWIKHRMQAGYARSRISTEGASVSDSIHQLALSDPSLKNYLVGQPEIVNPMVGSAEGRYARTSIIPAWAHSRAYGAGEEIAQSKIYNDARASGMSRTEATMKALQDQVLRKQAFNRGEALGQETQYTYNKSGSPDILNHNIKILKPFLMFSRRRLALPEMLYNTIRGDSKAMNILKRGVSQEATIADKYLFGKQVVKQFPDIIKKAPAEMQPQLKEAFSAMKDDLVNYKDFINKVERGPVRLKTASTFVRNVIGGGMINLMASTVAGTIKNLLGQHTGEQNYSEAFMRELPFMETQSSLTSPLLPDFSHGFGKPMARSAVRLGMKLFGGPLGVIDAAIPGSPVSGELNTLLGLDPEEK